MAAILAPRVEQLEKDHAILRRDHDCLANEVHDKETGLPAVNKRLNENDVLSAQVKIAIGIGKWILALLGTSIGLLLFNILTHSIEVVRP
jgi:hypothetical protein